MKQKIFLSKEPMSYKEQKKGNELITKYKIIYDVLVHKYPRVRVSDKYSMGRNTTGKLISDFKKNISPEVQEELLDASKSLSKLEIEEKLLPVNSPAVLTIISTIIYCIKNDTVS